MNNMYPFGTGAGDVLMQEDLTYSYRCLELGMPGLGLEFLGKRHETFWICRNGMIEFNRDYTRYWPRKFGLRYWDRFLPTIAPYWSLVEHQLFDSTTVFQFEGTVIDEIMNNGNRRLAHSGKRYSMRIDPKRQSKVYYQLYSRWNYTNAAAAMLNKSSDDVRKYTKNSLYNDFRASFVAVVTWVNVYPERLRNFPYFGLSNTFQTVIITDGVYTFTIFNYPSGGIQWAAPVDSSQSSRVNYWYRNYRLPVAGWNSGTDDKHRYFNIKQSSTLVMAQLSRLPGNTQETGRWFFQLDKSNMVRKAERKCYTWYLQQPTSPVSFLPPCPCWRRQAFFDRRFRYDRTLHREFSVSSRGVCYISRWRFQRMPYNIIDENTNLRRPVDRRLSAQRCCYGTDVLDFGSLLEGPERGGHERQQFSPPIQGFLSDEEAYSACCVESELCRLFYEKRPSDDCRSYRPPRRRWFWGDPHIVTMDNKNYTFNGLGEYIMADVQNGFFQLQARTAKALGDIATVFSAAVAQEQSTSKIEARLKSSGDGLDFFIDGSAFDYSSITNGSIDIGNLSISRDENDGVTATFPSGISVSFSQVKG
ncbi:mucin-like protein, partial [Actinia tenebrosa]|uniref:Mucin-like protein n=1 Tax=Actinia tenebrosa TaxID=6105 RepID=A0A6P8H9R9_ACTTE